MDIVKTTKNYMVTVLIIHSVTAMFVKNAFTQRGKPDPEKNKIRIIY